jgi:hypothetical protein
MKYTIAVAVLAGAIAAPLSARPQAASPSPSGPPRPRLSEVQPMGEDKRVKVDDVDSVMASGKVLFLDVREPKEIEEAGSYEGYLNIPMSQLESRLGELPRDRPILTA